VAGRCGGGSCSHQRRPEASSSSTPSPSSMVRASCLVSSQLVYAHFHFVSIDVTDTHRGGSAQGPRARAQGKKLSPTPSFSSSDPFFYLLPDFNLNDFFIDTTVVHRKRWTDLWREEPLSTDKASPTTVGLEAAGGDGSRGRRRVSLVPLLLVRW
jgi:hypothetical protein